jgi:hypothetical protein
VEKLQTRREAKPDALAQLVPDRAGVFVQEGDDLRRLLDFEHGHVDLGMPQIAGDFDIGDADDARGDLVLEGAADDVRQFTAEQARHAFCPSDAHQSSVRCTSTRSKHSI